MTSPVASAHRQSLRHHLARLEAAGELHVVREPVDLEFELAAYLCLLPSSRTVLFDAVRGHSAKIVANPLTNIVLQGRFDSYPKRRGMARVKELDADGVWGAVLHPSQGCFWYRMPDGALLSAVCRAHNDWIADFCKPYPDRFAGIAMINVDDVNEACLELQRCANLGLDGAHPERLGDVLVDRPFDGLDVELHLAAQEVVR